jgi:hypothetical protein
MERSSSAKAEAELGETIIQATYDPATFKEKLEAREGLGSMKVRLLVRRQSFNC